MKRLMVVVMRSLFGHVVVVALVDDGDLPRGGDGLVVALLLLQEAGLLLLPRLHLQPLVQPHGVHLHLGLDGL